MVEEFRYEDKRVGIDENDKWSLKNLVNEEFKKIDRYWYRDDQEIRNAWWNIINKLITEIKQDKNMVYGSWALDPLIQLSKKLKEEYNNMNWRKLITNNEDKINQVAQRIDNAENETLKRLAKNRTTQDSRDIVRRSNEAYKKNPMFVMEWWNDSSKQTWNIIFTKESNPVKIHEALNWLFKNPNVVYEIDYSGCTNQRIKDKMVWLIWTQTCYLKYDSSQNTYTIRDSQWNWISQRAYIWEWVKLIPAWVRQRHAYSEQKTQNEKLWKVDNSQLDSLTGAMLKDIPSAKRLTEEEQKNLVKKTEDRITELLRRAKKLWYELEPECVTKKWLWKWHVELHLNSGSSEVNWTVWGNNGSYNEILWEKLDDFIDSNEWEYVRYLMKRVVSKWQELDSLTKIETTNVEIEWWQNLTKEEREQAKLHRDQVLYWISLFEKMVDNYRESEWDSLLDNDDRKLLQIKQLIRNVKASITNSNAIDDGVLTLNFVDPIREKWAAIKGISKTVSGGYGQVYDNSSYKQQYDQLKKVFFWSYNEQISSIRDLWWFWRMFDKTETSFLQQEIENNGFDEWWQKLEVKYTKVNECIQKIYDFKVDLSQEAGDFDELWNLSSSWQEKVKELDDLYEKSKLEKSEFANYLSSLWLLPQNWKIENEMVLKAVESLKNRLINTQELLDNFSKTKESLVEGQHMKKLKLEQKENKTEEDLKELQALEYLEQNIEERDKIIEVTLNMMKVDLKYWWINQLLWSCLFESLIKLWWWAIWTNADIYNDIIWYGVFDLSDENAKIAGDFVWDILEEVVILAVAIAIGTVTAWAGTALIMWARATRLWAKGVKYGKYIYELANKVTKPIWKIVKRTGNFVKTSKTWQKIAKATESIKHTKLWKNLNKIRLEQNTAKLTASQGNRAEILRLWRKENKTLWDMYKLWSLVNKEWRMWTKMLAAIFEWTWFHLSSTAIHNAINWVDLSTWLNPFGYTEWPNWEKFSNFKWYVQSIAFLWILKFVGQPIQNLTQASLKTVLWEKISANAFWKILQQIGSITWEFWSLTVTDETINVIFEWELKELTVEDAVHSIGMILWLRAYYKIKQIANLKIKEYNRNKQELKVEIDGNDNVVTEDMLDRIRQQQEEKEQERKEQERKEQERNWNERPEWWINTERREMAEVPRNSDVIAIWDLHWEYVALKWNMEFAWLAREVNWYLEWTGWNKKVVFQWDILADRWTNWLRIIQEIHQLREQAKQQWWDIDIIVGNHDDFMISYLTWRNGVHWNWLYLSELGSPWREQWRWLTELAKFIWKDIWDFKNLDGRGTREAILQAMRNSPGWRIILEEICNMKLVSQVDDVLYCHTNPTAKMLQYLTKWNVQQNINLLNQKYQWYLRKTLLWEWNWNISLEEFNNISDIFLCTNNRRRYSSEEWLEQYTEALKNSWINMISHGHNWWDWYRAKQIWWIKIVDTDYSYWHSWVYTWEHSVSVIKKEWWVNYHWDNVAYANLEYPIWSEVYVKRTAWWETKSRVEWYNPKTKEYLVSFEEWWEIKTKSVTDEYLIYSSQLRTENLEWTFTYMMKWNLEWSTNMQVEYKWELYDNWMLKKWEKILPNWLVVEKGEYDINGNMIKWEKYIYEARMYDSEWMPITSHWAYKRTIFKGSSNDNIIIRWKINRMWEYTDTERLSYIIENEYWHIALEWIWDKTFIFHAWMHAKWESPTEREILQAERAAWKAFHELAATIPEWYKITETLSLSWDSFPLFLREYQRDFRTDYTVRATWKMIPLNSQWLNTPESKLIQSKDVGKDDRIFEAATQADAQEVADAINKLMKDRWQPLVEWQWIKELAEARVYKSFETWLWRVKIPQIEVVKEYNNGVELAQQLNKCKNYGELENILSENLSTEYHFRDGTLTWQQILDRCRLYREWKLVAPDEDPRRYFPSEFINPTKWRSSEWIPTWHNTTRKSNIHNLLDS